MLRTVRLGKDSEATSELMVWIALRRACRGGVAKTTHSYLDHGLPVPSFLVRPLDELTGAGLLAVDDADPATEGPRTVAVTATGQDRYAALCRHQRGSTW